MVIFNFQDLKISFGRYNSEEDLVKFVSLTSVINVLDLAYYLFYIYGVAYLWKR